MSGVHGPTTKRRCNALQPHPTVLWVPTRHERRRWSTENQVPDMPRDLQRLLGTLARQEPCRVKLLHKHRGLHQHSLHCKGCT